MNYTPLTNNPFVQIGFARTYGELPDEYSNFLCGKKCKEKKEAEAQAIRAKAEIDRAIAGELSKGTSAGNGEGLSTGAKIGIGIGIVAVLGITIYLISR